MIKLCVIFNYFFCLCLQLQIFLYVCVQINNHGISQLLNDEDKKLLNYITDFEVITEEGYKIIFKFKENPIFSNTELVKEYKLVHKECCKKEEKEGECCKDKCCGGGCCGGCCEDDEDEEVVVPFKVQWKNAAAHDIKKMEEVPFSLFAWFDSEISENSDFPDNVLIEGLSDLYLKAVGYFQGTETSVEFEEALCEMMGDDEDEDEEDEEDEEEDDDE